MGAMSVGFGDLRHFWPHGKTAEIRNLSDRKVYRGTIMEFNVEGVFVNLVLERVYVRHFNLPAWFEEMNLPHMSFQFDACASRLVNRVHITLKSSQGLTCHIWHGGCSATAALVPAQLDT